MSALLKQAQKQSLPLVAANPLGALHDILADDMAAVNHVITTRLDSGVPLIPQLAQYLIAAGGKRIRPLLTLASGQLCHAPALPMQLLASAVEFIHTATLLHDDVVDESNERRGRASANQVFGNQASVLVGDFLFARAFEMMVEAGSLPALNILSHAAAQIVEGEVMQLKILNEVNLSEAEYLKVIEAKTAMLFAASMEVGGVMGDALLNTQKALRDYGYHLGIAFQINDDVLDYVASSETLGKEIGHDFREGKMTLPVILAYQAGNETERAFWARVMGTPELQTEDDLAMAQNYLTQHQAAEKCRVIAHSHAAAAAGALATLPRHPLCELLAEIAEFAVTRQS